MRKSGKVLIGSALLGAAGVAGVHATGLAEGQEPTPIVQTLSVDQLTEIQRESNFGENIEHPYFNSDETLRGYTHIGNVTVPSQRPESEFNGRPYTFEVFLNENNEIKYRNQGTNALHSISGIYDIDNSGSFSRTELKSLLGGQLIHDSPQTTQAVLDKVFDYRDTQSRQEIARLNEESDTYEAQVQRITIERDNFREDYEAIQESLSEMIQEATSNLQNENDQLRGRNSELESELTSLQTIQNPQQTESQSQEQQDPQTKQGYLDLRASALLGPFTGDVNDLSYGVLAGVGLGNEHFRIGMMWGYALRPMQRTISGPIPIGPNGLEASGHLDEVIHNFYSGGEVGFSVPIKDWNLHFDAGAAARVSVLNESKHEEEGRSGQDPYVEKDQTRTTTTVSPVYGGSFGVTGPRGNGVVSGIIYDHETGDVKVNIGGIVNIPVYRETRHSRR